MSNANVSSSAFRSLMLVMIFVGTIFGGGFMLGEGRKADNTEKDKVWFGTTYVLLSFVFLLLAGLVFLRSGRVASNMNVGYKPMPVV